MIPWNRAYRRLAAHPDFRVLFGKRYRQDEFSPIAYALKFDALSPATLAPTATPNTGDIATTIANMAAPTTQVIAPGTPQSKQVVFPHGAVILTVSASAAVPLRTQGGFTYGPTRNPGNRDLFMLDLDFTSGDPIISGNPISELVSNPNSTIITAPPVMADALTDGGERDNFLGQELWVTPGLGLLVGVRSLLLPSSLPAGAQNQAIPPNLTVHVVFHAMVPGKVKYTKQAA